MQFSSLILAGAALAASAPACASEPVDAARLSEAKVTLAETSSAGMPGKSFTAGTIIAAPVAALCALLQDYDAYPAYMPNTESVKVSEKGAGYAVIDVTLGLPMGKIKKYRLRMEPRSGPDACRITWKMLPWPGLKQEETIVDTKGYWQLAPSSTPGKTVVRYVVYTDAGPIPFGLGWIVDSLSKDSIPQTLEALRKRAGAR